jgi:hypothetical protein
MAAILPALVGFATRKGSAEIAFFIMRTIKGVISSS